jgi:hypothetical protein
MIEGNGGIATRQTASHPAKDPKRDGPVISYLDTALGNIRKSYILPRANLPPEKSHRLPPFNTN